MRYILPLIILFISLSCEQPIAISDRETQTIFLDVTNFPALRPGAGMYEAWVSFTSPRFEKNGSTFDNDSTFVSIGKFNVGARGRLFGKDGKPFEPEFAKLRSRLYMVDAIITIELESDSDDVPGSVIIGGAITGDEREGRASLIVDYTDAFRTNFKLAGGSFLLSAPTSSLASDSTSGVWFMLSVAPESAGLRNLPPLPIGWKYEGWVSVGCDSDGSFTDQQLYSAGKFISAFEYDDDKAGSRKGSNGDGFHFPGSDFSGFNLNCGNSSVGISIEPEPDNDPLAPFSTLMLFDWTRIPENAPQGRSFTMTNIAESFPTAKLTILR